MQGGVEAGASGVVREMGRNRQFDFIYAAAHTRVARPPARPLETFGATRLEYTLAAELDDYPGKIRIREGVIEARAPLVITPEAYVHDVLEGFGEEAHRFHEWLKANGENIKILQYGYRLSQETFSEQVVAGTLEEIMEKITAEAARKANPFHAVIEGVDDPWDVCLLQFFRMHTDRSVPVNVRELERAHRREMAERAGAGRHPDVERAFAKAEKDVTLVKELGAYLQRRGLFNEYQDRFFRLVRRGQEQ